MPFINKTFVEDVLSEADVVSVIRDFEKDLKRVGANWKCKSPFRDEKTASFVVSPAKGVWKDFGGGQGGGSVDYLMKAQGMTFPEAIEYLADHLGKPVEYDERVFTEEEKGKYDELQDCKKMMNWAVDKYHQTFMDLPADHPAKLEVYENRKYTEADAKMWKIGFAPGNSLLRDIFYEKGKVHLAKQIFLVTDKNDRYVNRVVYPIKRRGSGGYYFSGFGGRNLGNKDQLKKYGKWINPSTEDNPLYNKDVVLYGFEEAIPSIHKYGYAIVVEGYNDVASLHRIGLTHTVGTCGTAFTDGQMRLLKAKTKRVMLFLDGDEAAAKAAEKDVNDLVKLGFTVKVLDLFAKQRKALMDGKKEGVDEAQLIKTDPDEWARAQFDELGDEDSDQSNLMDELTLNSREGLIWLAERLFGTKDKLELGKGVSKLCELLSYVEDDFTRTMYIDDLSKNVKGVTKTMLLKKVEDHKQKIDQENHKKSFKAKSDDSYSMPHGLEEMYPKYEKDIRDYKVFQHKNVIYSRRGSEGAYNFEVVSNFSIEIIQHMEDEKFPMKLVKMTNQRGKVRIFDSKSEDFTSEQRFKIICTNRGNYDWKGKNLDFERLTTKLYDEMGEGAMIQVLGWQPEGFWAFCDQIIFNGKNEDVDEYGVFHFQGSSFYVPAGNKIYANNTSKFLPQKQCSYIESNVTFTELSAQLMKVHRKHSMNALLFTIGTYFSDLIYSRVSCFPILFLYGEASTGKDNLIEACQSFFGEPQSALTMTGKANTDKAKIRKFAQFRNMIVHMSEYTRGMSDVDQMLKSIWDRRGYERGTIDSAVGTESVSIESTLMFTGNEYPDNDALITRILAEEMNKDTFTQDEKEEYEKLKDMVQDGYSYLSTDILAERKNFEKNFRKTYKETGAELKVLLKHISLADRMIQNAAVLGSVYKLMSKRLHFPFTYEDWTKNLVRVYEKQSRKRDTGSVAMMWWDAFVYAVKTKQEPLKENYEFDLRSNLLHINYKHCFMRLSKMWFEVYRGAIPSQNIMLDKLKKSDGFLEIKNKHRFGGRSSSAMVFDLQKSGVKEDLLNVIDQLNSHRVSSEPDLLSEESDENEEDLPF